MTAAHSTEPFPSSFRSAEIAAHRLALWLLLGCDAMFFAAVFSSTLLLRTSHADLFHRFAMPNATVLEIAIALLPAPALVWLADRCKFKSRLLPVLLLVGTTAFGLLFIGFTLVTFTRMQRHIFVLQRNFEPGAHALLLYEGDLISVSAQELMLSTRQQPRPVEASIDLQTISPARTAPLSELDRWSVQDIPRSSIVETIRDFPPRNIALDCYCLLLATITLNVMIATLWTCCTCAGLLMGGSGRLRLPRDRLASIGCYWNFIAVVLILFVVYFRFV